MTDENSIRRYVTAVRIVDALIADLKDRRGLRQEWEAIDPDIQQEIRDRWIAITMTMMGPTHD